MTEKEMQRDKHVEYVNFEIDFFQKHFSSTYIQTEFTGLPETWIVCNVGRIKVYALMYLVVLQISGLIILILTPRRPSRAFLFNLQNM